MTPPIARYIREHQSHLLALSYVLDAWERNKGQMLVMDSFSGDEVARAIRGLLAAAADTGAMSRSTFSP